MNNMIQVLQTIKNMRNPQQYVMGELNKMASQNPMVGMVMKNGNYETVVRNMCKQKRIDIDSLADTLYGERLRKVLCHELCHCLIFSMNLYFDLYQEERLADFIATYARDIINISDEIYKRINEST